MYGKILIPLDGSELAETIFRRARWLMSRLEVGVNLLYVAHPNEPELLPMYQAYIQHQAERLSSGESGVARVRAEVMGGYPADSILRYADLNEIDLIMIASHGRSGIRRFVLGSVADRVLRASKVPVWLIRAGRPGGKELKKVLVPLDGSLLAERVLPHVEALAKPANGAVEVTLLRVSEPPVSLGPEQTRSWSRLIEEHLMDAGKIAEEYLALVGVRLANHGISANSEVLVGEPASQIADYAARRDFDLIAIASHGHSGITRWAYGNVADRIVRGAPCDVFLVRPV